MLAKDNAAGYSTTTVVLSWLVLLSFTTTFIVSVSWPTMDVSDPVRDYRRLLHMSCGVVTAILIVLRLIWWCKNPFPKAPKGMPDNEFGLSRILVLFFYIDILGLAITGFMNSWAMSYEVSFLGLFTLPIIGGTTVSFAGYFHSAFLFFNNCMMLSFVLINLYHSIRYKVGFRRWLPGSMA